MARTAIANGDTGLSARTSLNTLFCNSTSADPTTANDNTQGYGIGSAWLNTTTGIFWECTDATTNAAVWARQSRFRRRNFRSGVYYMALPNVVLAAGTNASTTINCLPFEIEEAVTLSELGAMVTTLFSGGNFMLGIYANNYATGRLTGNPLASVVNLSTTAATVVSKALAANVTFQPGIYWLASQSDNATSVLQSINQNTVYMTSMIGSATLSRMSGASAASLLELRVTNTYANGFPDMTSATFAETVTGYGCAALNFKVA